jgi:hypothetical protein
LPIVLFAGPTYLYLKYDPYFDFGPYSNYSWKYKFQGLGDLGAKKILNSSTRYNSFIFSSSRGTTIYGCYLNSLIPNSQFFHFANWNETVGGIYDKLRFLDSMHYDIKNVVMYLDTDRTFEGDGSANLINNHYLVTQQDKLTYYFSHFRFFFSRPSVDKVKILMGRTPSQEMYPNWHSDPSTNDPKHICADSILEDYGNRTLSKKDSVAIDSLLLDDFLYKRSAKQTYKNKQISETEKKTLIKIKELLDKHDTNYIVVITPLYDQLKFHNEDIDILNSVFSDHMYDFSGINEITDNPYNYPDRVHFRPWISKMIIDSVVSDRPSFRANNISK